MTQPLTKNAQSIQSFLNGNGLKCKVLELSASTRTAAEAANAIGCEVAQIAKSLIFKTCNSSKPVLVLVSGVNKVNEKTISNLVGESIEKADADFVRDITGFAIGGIPPFGHSKQIDFILIDEDLLQFEVVWAAAGTPFSVFNIKMSDMIKLASGKVTSIK